MTKSVVIVAGGSGTRMNSEIPKQFLLVNGKPLLYYTLKAFCKFDVDIEIVLVLPEEFVEYWNKQLENISDCPKHTVALGGESRFHSVRNGLEKVTGEMIAVHDGVRVLIAPEDIERYFRCAEEYGNAIPVIEVADTIRRIEKDKTIQIDRSKLRRIQTPQIFKAEDLKKAYSNPYFNEFTDDASVAESSGVKVHLTKGNPENIKVTTPFDYKIVKAILNEQK